MTRLERVGAYVLGEAFSAGGTATVHLGRRTTAPAPLTARTMAVKRLRPELAGDPQLVELLVREAHLSARLRHANLVAVSDVVEHRGEVLLVSEYVHGVSLRCALAQTGGAGVPVPVAVAIARDVLSGLDAAHVLSDAAGTPLGIVHRDVAPENIVVGVDGSARLLDFGIAVALGRGRYTRTGELRGKLGYLSSEHAHGEKLDARADVYSLAAVLWEMLAGRPLFDASPGPALLEQITLGLVDPVRRHRLDVPAALDELLGRALSQARELRPASAAIFARELSAVATSASAAEVASWIEQVAADEIVAREAAVVTFERAAAADAAAALEEVTEVSEPQRAALRGEEPRRSGGGMLILAAGALMIASGWLGTGLLRRDPAPLAETDAGLVALPVSTAVTAMIDGAAPLPPVSASPVAMPVALPVPSAPRRPPDRARTVKRRPASSCDPPFTIGADGTKKYKRECVL